MYFLFFPKNRIWYFLQIVSKETICMKYQILFYGENKQTIINLLFAKFAQLIVDAFLT